MSKYAIKREDQVRATRNGARASTVPQLMAGGVYKTYVQMGVEMGVSRDEAYRRYSNAKNRGTWPISYEDMRA